MENFETRKLDAADYHKAHPYMKSLDKVLTHYFVTKTEDPAIHVLKHRVEELEKEVKEDG